MREKAEALNKEQGLPDVETRAKAIPMLRPGYPDEIANVVAFMASDQAAYMTGQAINVTGGLWMS
jgi:NAD(P)-dependent dehydrogenase (short-subunit alcohol dehydrogenase family)